MIPNADGYYQNVERVLAKTKKKQEPIDDEYTEETAVEEETEGEGGK